MKRKKLELAKTQKKLTDEDDPGSLVEFIVARPDDEEEESSEDES